MISRFVQAKSIPNSAKGFSMTFAAEPFDHDVELAWLSPDEVAEEFNCSLSQLPGEGNWYRGVVAGREMVGWLCPASSATSTRPRRRFSIRPSRCLLGVDPIWHVKADDPRARRFVSAPGELQE